METLGFVWVLCTCPPDKQWNQTVNNLHTLPSSSALTRAIIFGPEARLRWVMSRLLVQSDLLSPALSQCWVSPKCYTMTYEEILWNSEITTIRVLFPLQELSSLILAFTVTNFRRYEIAVHKILSSPLYCRGQRMKWQRKHASCRYTFRREGAGKVNISHRRLALPIPVTQVENLNYYSGAIRSLWSGLKRSEKPMTLKYHSEFMFMDT